MYSNVLLSDGGKERMKLFPGSKPFNIQQQNGMMIWPINDYSCKMSPKLILIKESTCKGIHLLYAGTGKKLSL